MDIKVAIFHLKMIFRRFWNPGSCLPRAWCFPGSGHRPGQDQTDQPEAVHSDLYLMIARGKNPRPYPDRPHIGPRSS